MTSSNNSIATRAGISTNSLIKYVLDVKPYRSKLGVPRGGFDSGVTENYLFNDTFRINATDANTIRTYLGPDLLPKSFTEVGVRTRQNFSWAQDLVSNGVRRSWKLPTFSVPKYDSQSRSDAFTDENNLIDVVRYNPFDTDELEPILGVIPGMGVPGAVGELADSHTRVFSYRITEDQKITRASKNAVHQQETVDYFLSRGVFSFHTQDTTWKPTNLAAVNTQPWFVAQLYFLPEVYNRGGTLNGISCNHYREYKVVCIIGVDNAIWNDRQGLAIDGFPVSPLVNDLWYMTDENAVYQFDGSIWVVVTDSNGTAVDSNHQTLLSVHTSDDDFGVSLGTVTIGNLFYEDTYDSSALLFTYTYPKDLMDPVPPYDTVEEMAMDGSGGSPQTVWYISPGSRITIHADAEPEVWSIIKTNPTVLAGKPVFTAGGAHSEDPFIEVYPADCERAPISDWTLMFNGDGTYQLISDQVAGYEGPLGKTVDLIDGCSYKDENVAFTIGPSKEGWYIGESFTWSFVGDIDRTNFQVYGSKSGWTYNLIDGRAAKYDKWFFNGKIGFKIPSLHYFYNTNQFFEIDVGDDPGEFAEVTNTLNGNIQTTLNGDPIVPELVFTKPVTSIAVPSTYVVEFTVATGVGEPGKATVYSSLSGYLGTLTPGVEWEDKFVAFKIMDVALDDDDNLIGTYEFAVGDKIVFHVATPNTSTRNEGYNSNAFDFEPYSYDQENDDWTRPLVIGHDLFEPFFGHDLVIFPGTSADDTFIIDKVFRDRVQLLIDDGGVMKTLLLEMTYSDRADFTDPVGEGTSPSEFSDLSTFAEARLMGTTQRAFTIKSPRYKKTDRHASSILTFDEDFFAEFLPLGTKYSIVVRPKSIFGEVARVKLTEGAIIYSVPSAKTFYVDLATSVAIDLADLKTGYALPDGLGTVLLAGHRVLVKDQADQADNGIYVIDDNSIGQPSDATEKSTETNFDFSGAIVYVIGRADPGSQTTIFGYPNAGSWVNINTINMYPPRLIQDEFDFERFSDEDDYGGRLGYHIDRHSSWDLVTSTEGFDLLPWDWKRWDAMDTNAAVLGISIILPPPETTVSLYFTIMFVDDGSGEPIGPEGEEPDPIPGPPSPVPAGKYRSGQGKDYVDGIYFDIPLLGDWVYSTATIRIVGGVATNVWIYLLPESATNKTSFIDNDSDTLVIDNDALADMIAADPVKYAGYDGLFAGTGFEVQIGVEGYSIL